MNRIDREKGIEIIETSVDYLSTLYTTDFLKFIDTIDNFLKKGIIEKDAFNKKEELLEILLNENDLHNRQEILCKNGKDNPKTVFLNIVLKSMGLIEYNIDSVDAEDINSFSDLIKYISGTNRYPYRNYHNIFILMDTQKAEDLKKLSKDLPWIMQGNYQSIKNILDSDDILKNFKELAKLDEEFAKVLIKNSIIPLLDSDSFERLINTLEEQREGLMEAMSVNNNLWYIFSYQETYERFEELKNLSPDVTWELLKNGMVTEVLGSRYTDIFNQIKYLINKGKHKDIIALSRDKDIIAKLYTLYLKVRSSYDIEF